MDAKKSANQLFLKAHEKNLVDFIGGGTVLQEETVNLIEDSRGRKGRAFTKPTLTGEF